MILDDIAGYRREQLAREQAAVSASECGWKRASGFRFKLQEKRWKVLYCDRPLAEVHRADDHRRFVRAACRLL